MTLSTALARGRALAESLMVDTCSIRRPSGWTTDDNTGERVPAWTAIYAGKCKLQQTSTGGAAKGQEPGEDYQLHTALELHIPISGDTPALRVGDEITITAATYDPQLAGQVFLVRDLLDKSIATARRVGVTRRTS